MASNPARWAASRMRWSSRRPSGRKIGSYFDRLLSPRATSTQSPMASASAMPVEQLLVALAAADGIVGQRRAPLHDGLDAHALGTDRLGFGDGLVGPLDGLVGAVLQHADLGQQRQAEGPLLAGREHGDDPLQLGQDPDRLVHLVALVVHPGQHPQRGRLRARGRRRATTSPGWWRGRRASSSAPMSHAARAAPASRSRSSGASAKRLDGQAQRLVRRPPAQVVDHALAGEVDHLVVAAGAGGVAGQVGEVGAGGLAQRGERLLVEAAPLPAEQLTLDGVAHEGVAEAELVVVLLDQQAPVDEAPGGGRSARPRCSRSGRPARRTGARRPSTAAASTTRRSVGVDSPSSWRRTSSASDHGSGCSARLLGVQVAGGGQDLLEEEGVAAGAAPQRVDRRRCRVGGRTRRRGRRATSWRREPVEAHLVDLVATLEAHAASRRRAARGVSSSGR